MRLTVLGKSPSWQDAGGACSGYLIEEGDTAVLVDCGNGVFAKLRERIDYVDVDAVVLSHLHADHFLDLVPYAYALTEALADFARDADLMLVEATLPRPERTGMRGHLTPEEAGGHARGAAAKQLLLVHISDELDADWARDEAAEVFGGPVEV